MLQRPEPQPHLHGRHCASLALHDLQLVLQRAYRLQHRCAVQAPVSSQARPAQPRAAAHSQRQLLPALQSFHPGDQECGEAAVRGSAAREGQGCRGKGMCLQRQCGQGQLHSGPGAGLSEPTGTGAAACSRPQAAACPSAACPVSQSFCCYTKLRHYSHP